ncbi:hypothetical protein Bccel_1655 [Pseudobacteroides cellulosolvens ATCC 35603 = DSM 2933]|uniref:Uncharacterized protein n=1 Tax=Pseudobacteroides cellulosolvens ATCC 35603 = DSM 2933 TaxID=398512 RepID=A0A0L6JKZ9_9FIRM|nr:hypothetical protein Bccel_1655 [Pseudobacteroides cellulosolvens ATCC 35603 = DSM 2933]
MIEGMDYIKCEKILQILGLKYVKHYSELKGCW